MKHVFFVHSPITLMISNLIINKNKLQKKRVLFLTSRGFRSNDNEIEQVDFFFVKDWQYIPQTRNILKSFRALRQFDNFLQQKLKGSAFKLYLPHTANRAFELIINSKYCNSFSIIEEGLGAYYDMALANRDYLNNRVSIWDRIGYLNRIKKKLFFRPDYEFVYGLTEEAFPKYERRQILPLLSIKKGKDPLHSNQIFFVFDNIITGDILKRINLQKYINPIIERHGDFNRIFYKFHPSHTQKERVELYKSLQFSFPNMTLLELDGSCFIERIAAESLNSLYFVNVSSVGYYAAYLGHNVYSYAKLLSGIVGKEFYYGYTDYNIFLDELPIAFKNRVRFL